MSNEVLLLLYAVLLSVVGFLVRHVVATMAMAMAMGPPYSACRGHHIPWQVMRESLAKLENLCLGSTAKDNDWTSVVEDTR